MKQVLFVTPLAACRFLISDCTCMKMCGFRKCYLRDWKSVYLHPLEALHTSLKGRKMDSQNPKGLVNPLAINTIKAIMTVVDSKGVSSVIFGLKVERA